jgi:hypothetical protein
VATWTGWLGPFTGDGVVAINGGVGVTPNALDASVSAILNPQVRKIGTVRPYRLLYAGSFGFSFSENDHTATPRDFVVYEHPLSFEFMDLSINDFSDTGNNATHIWYRLRNGVESYFGCWYL